MFSQSIFTRTTEAEAEGPGSVVGDGGGGGGGGSSIGLRGDISKHRRSSGYSLWKTEVIRGFGSLKERKIVMLIANQEFLMTDVEDVLTSFKAPQAVALGLKPTDEESATLGTLSCDQEIVTGPGETRAALLEYAV